MGIKETYKRIRMGVLRRKYIIYNLYFKKRYPLQILNTEQTIKKILQEKSSVCRFGDGELRMIDQAYTIGFQEYSEKLSERLEQVLNSHNDRILICLPYTIYSTEHMNQKAAVFWQELFLSVDIISSI